MFASPLVGIVSPEPSRFPGSGPITPDVESPEGKAGAGVVVGCAGAASGVLEDVGSEGLSTRLGCSGSAAIDDRRIADSATPGAGAEAVKRAAWRVDRSVDGGRTAMRVVSEIVGAGAGGASVAMTAACESPATGLLGWSTGPFGAAALGPDGAIATNSGGRSGAGD
jgi:hypothetical protein